jgi:hypothetical protein
MGPRQTNKSGIKKRKTLIREKPIKEQIDGFYSDHGTSSVNPAKMRQEMYKIFEIHGFAIVDEAYLYAYIRYYDPKGEERIELHQFMTMIEFMPFEIRIEFYEAISDYIHHQYATNVHMMPTTEKELKKYLAWKAKTIRVLKRSQES